MKPKCECRHGANCPCLSRPRPAEVEVTRNGKRIKVCSLCDLPTDKDWKIIPPVLN